MTRSTCSRLLGLAAALALTQFPSTAAACTVCMGDPNSKFAGASNAAVFLLLGFIGTVLALLVAFGVTLMKRANSPLPPHAEFSQSESQTGAHS